MYLGKIQKSWYVVNFKEYNKIKSSSTVIQVQAMVIMDKRKEKD
jgi:hypothetical protein